jgi:hypothetical protein
VQRKNGSLPALASECSACLLRPDIVPKTRTVRSFPPKPCSIYNLPAGHDLHRNVTASLRGKKQSRIFFISRHSGQITFQAAATEKVLLLFDPMARPNDSSTRAEARRDRVGKVSDPTTPRAAAVNISRLLGCCPAVFRRENKDPACPPPRRPALLLVNRQKY